MYYSLYTFPPPTALDAIAAPSPVYINLIIGMFLFLASNIMPNLLPVPDRFLSVTARTLCHRRWDFACLPKVM
jgi:hypothetical protein